MQCLHFFTLLFFHQALTAPSNIAPLLFLSTPSSSSNLKCYAGTEGDPHLSIDTCSSADIYCLKFDGDIIDRFGNHYSGEGVGCQESFTPKVAAACTSVGYHKIDVQDGDSYFNGTVYCCDTDLCDPTDDFFLTTTLNPSPCVDVDSDCTTMSKECTNSLYKPLMCKYCQVLPKDGKKCDGRDCGPPQTCIKQCIKGVCETKCSPSSEDCTCKNGICTCNPEPGKTCTTTCKNGVCETVCSGRP